MFWSVKCFFTTRLTTKRCWFTTSCKAEMWVVDDLGNVVFDSRDETNCLDIELEMAADNDETERFTLPQWNFFTADGCKPANPASTPSWLNFQNSA